MYIPGIISYYVRFVTSVTVTATSTRSSFSIFRYWYPLPPPSLYVYCVLHNRNNFRSVQAKTKNTQKFSKRYKCPQPIQELAPRTLPACGPFVLSLEAIATPISIDKPLIDLKIHQHQNRQEKKKNSNFWFNRLHPPLVYGSTNTRCERGPDHKTHMIPRDRRVCNCSIKNKNWLIARQAKT